jgi:photosystem II stability/assembly factor-like uncharacterized protein
LIFCSKFWNFIELSSSHYYPLVSMRYLVVLGCVVVSFFCVGAFVYQALEQDSFSLSQQIELERTAKNAETNAQNVAFQSIKAEDDDELNGGDLGDKEGFSEGLEEGESISERRKYELMRLADPTTGQIPNDALVRERIFTRTLPTRDQELGRQKGGSSLQSFDWISRGPTGTGGRTRAIAIDADNERVMLAGSVSGGLWRTENGGTSWSQVATPDGGNNISCIVQDTRPGKRNVWYYGTGEVYTQFLGTGIYKSVDGGRSWRSLPATLPTLLTRAAQYLSPWSVVIRITIDLTKLNQDVVYAAIGGNIMRSSDGGETWQTALGNTSVSNSNAAYYTDVAIASNGVVYAALSELDYSFQLSSFAVQSGIWRSTNGVNWTNISPQIAGQSSSMQVARMVLAVAPSDSNTLYVLRDVRTPSVASGIKTGLLRYTYLSGTGVGASGGSWTDYTTTFPQDFSSQTGYCMALKVKPDDQLFVVAGGIFAYSNPYNFRYRETTSLISAYATDADIPTPPTQSWADHHDFAFLPSNPNVMFVANDGGIYRTDNCTVTSVRYTSLNNNYISTQFYSLAIDHAKVGDETIIGGLQDNGTRIVSRTDASGRLIGLGDGIHCAIADSGRYYYTASQNANISRFEFDARARRTNVIRVSPSASSFQRFFLDNPYVLDRNNQSTMYLAGGTSLWRNTEITSLSTTQLQAAWKNIGSVGTDERITSFAVSERPANVVYVGTSRGRVYRMDNATAPDSLRKFIHVSGNFPQNAFTSCVALDPTNADWAVAVFSNYNVQSIFATTDGGKTWSAVGGNLEETMNGVGGGPSVAWVKVVYVGGKVWYFAGTSSGLFSTDRLNGAATRWVREGTNTIGMADVRMIDARSKDGFVAVATHGNGLFTAYLPTQTRRFNAEAQTIVLGQSYPNPASRTDVTIPFLLPRSARVTLTLWNALGQAISTPLEANLTAGEQFFLMPTSNIPAGVYVYRIEAEGLQAQGSMVIRP